MSRIGKNPIAIPAGVEVTVTDAMITVKGPKGTLTRAYKPVVTITVADGHITLAPKKTDTVVPLWGTYSSHVKNMLAGVVTPFTKKLILEGVGYKSEVKGTDLHLALGFSHPVVVAIPSDITMTAEKNVLTFTGINKESVGSFAAKIRALKKPEPYKGKGFRYDDEVIRRKQGKKAA